MLDELIDRYGDPPPSVSDLVNVSLVRVQASTVGVTEVTQKRTPSPCSWKVWSCP